MNALRLWILLLGATCFLAGVATARLLSAPAPVQSTPFDAYAERFAQTFEFADDPELVGSLRVLLRYYEEEKRRIETRHLAEYRAAMEDKLVALGRQYEGWIRDKVLPLDQRERYDLLSGSLSLAQAPR